MNTFKRLARNEYIKMGFGFGITSGVLTTLGMMVGMYSAVGSKLAIIGGILSIAIADAFADAFGMHVSTEGEKHVSYNHIMQASGSTFIFKLLFAFSFMIPVLLFSLGLAMVVGVLWGAFLVVTYSVHLARLHKKNVIGMAIVHLGISLLTVALTYGVGLLVNAYFS